jgi:Leucine-rich repeat (LRR) protein
MASDEVLRRIKEAARCNSKELNLGYQKLTEVPTEVFQLQNLTGLNLSGNQIVKIPDAISQLQNLTGLNLSGNQIVKIPDAISQLQNLILLSLYNNKNSKNTRCYPSITKSEIP